MKKKILLVLSCALVLMLVFAVTAFAESVHEGKVDLSATVTLDNGTVVPLFDAEGEALTWYLDGGELKSIRTDDQRIKWYTQNYTDGEVTSVSIIFEDGKTIANTAMVVVNMLDDGVVKNYGPGEKYYGGPVDYFKTVFNNCKKLEYIYLRLDTKKIQKQMFNGCENLKYINLSDLTKLTRIGDGQNFYNCKKLFAGQVLDLSRTALTSIDNGGSFANVPMTGVILPKTIKTISSWTFQATAIVSVAFPTTVTKLDGTVFKNCASLETIYLNNTLTSIGDNAFLGCTSLNTVFYVGSLDELNALLDSANTSSNAPFWAVVGNNRENLISYADYQKLSDKSGKYMVYDYSYCEAYNNGVHSENSEWYNPCVSFCDVCSCTVVSHADENAVITKIEYADFSKAGSKVAYCTNEGCTHNVNEDVRAIFVCLGYSAQENGDSIVLGYLINREECDAYTSTMNNEFSYGVFVVLKDTIGNNEIFGDDGKVTQGAVTAKISNNPYNAFVLKINGVANDQKDIKLALGAYVSYEENGVLKYSYMQVGSPLENAKYSFTSFNEIVAGVK